jgi:hypothetical protein
VSDVPNRRLLAAPELLLNASEEGSEAMNLRRLWKNTDFVTLWRSQRLLAVSSLSSNADEDG